MCGGCVCIYVNVVVSYVCKTWDLKSIETMAYRKHLGFLTKEENPKYSQDLLNFSFANLSRNFPTHVLHTCKCCMSYMYIPGCRFRCLLMSFGFFIINFDISFEFFFCFFFSKGGEIRFFVGLLNY